MSFEKDFDFNNLSTQNKGYLYRYKESTKKVISNFECQRLTEGA